VKYPVRIAALAAVIALSAAACGDKPNDSAAAPESSTTPGSSPSSSTPPESHPDVTACMVSDSGGFDDKGFNQTAYKGLTDAVTDLGVKKAQVESNTDSDYVNNINAMIQQNCNVIVSAGYKLADATLAAAKKNPDINFAIVDYTDYKSPPKNLRELGFNTAQTSFLAGYLAAGMTKTGKVGTLGGVNIPTVTIFMDGFWEGVQYYNQQKGTDVQVLGWDETTQKGLFTNDFENKTVGQTTAENLISQGADIILPVAGPAGLGALQAVKDSGGQVNGIWVDTDGCVSAAEYCPELLTSVNKGMDVAVEDAISDDVKGTFDNTEYIGTLENGGTGLAPYHDWDSKIPDELKSEIDQLKQGIIDGTITIKSKSQPAP